MFDVIFFKFNLFCNINVYVDDNVADKEVLNHSDKLKIIRPIVEMVL